ncbi:V-type proton ATPase subunit B2, partial [Tanacetum coccineum]
DPVNTSLHTMDHEIGTRNEEKMVAIATGTAELITYHTAQQSCQLAFGSCSIQHVCICGCLWAQAVCLAYQVKMGVAKTNGSAEEGTLEIGMEYRTVSGVAGPLVILDKVEGKKNKNKDQSIMAFHYPIRRWYQSTWSQVLDVDGERRVFEGTSGIDNKFTTVQFTGEVLKTPVSMDMLGRIFNGSGKPIDNGPPILPEAYLDISGSSINPSERTYPEEMISTLGSSTLT